MTQSETIIFKRNDEKIVATIDWNSTKNKPTILSLHGGGESARNRTAYLTEELARAGHSCLRFDFLGWGESIGDRKQSSLKKRLDEALAATEWMDRTQPITVIGTSMGAATAMEMTRHIDIANIVLFCPALYAKEVFDLPFDESFTAMLRQENSFLKTDIDLLRNYKGKFLHLIGDRDGIIPDGVTDIYQNNIINAAQFDFLFLENCGHQIHDYLQENKSVKDAVLACILEMIKT